LEGGFLLLKTDMSKRNVDRKTLRIIARQHLNLAYYLFWKW